MYILFLMIFLAFFFSSFYFIIRIHYIIHVTYKLCVDQLFMLPVRLPLKSRLLVKFLEKSKVICRSSTEPGVQYHLHPTPALFKGQLYVVYVTVFDYAYYIMVNKFPCHMLQIAFNGFIVFYNIDNPWLNSSSLLEIHFAFKMLSIMNNVVISIFFHKALAVSMFLSLG